MISAINQHHTFLGGCLLSRFFRQVKEVAVKLFWNPASLFLDILRISLLINLMESIVNQYTSF